MPQLQDQPLDFSKKSDAKYSPVAVPRYPFDVSMESPRADMDYRIPSASGASLDTRSNPFKAAFHSPAYSVDPRVDDAWPLFQNPFPLMLQKTGSKRKSDGGLPDRWANMSASSAISAHSGFDYMQHSPSNGLDQLHSAITANHSSEPFQRTGPFMNPLAIAMYAADLNFKPLPLPPGIDANKTDQKFSKQRPFKAVKPEILNTDFSKQIAEKNRLLESVSSMFNATGLPQSSPALDGGVRAYAPQSMETAEQLNASGHIGNGESSATNGENASLNGENASLNGENCSPNGENSCPNRETSSPKAENSNGSMGNTSSESVKTDRSDSGVVGSTQPDEDGHNLEGTILRTTPPRRKGKPIDVNQKDESYWQKRNKNNVAAKKSRDARKKREDQLALKVHELYMANQTLMTQLHDYERVLLTAKGKYEQEHEKYTAEVERGNQMGRFIEEMMKSYSGCTSCRPAITKFWSR